MITWLKNLFNKKQKDDSKLELKKDLAYVKFYLDDDTQTVNLDCYFLPECIDSFVEMIALINSGFMEESFMKISPPEVYKKYIALKREIEDTPVVQPYQAFQGKNM